MASPDGAANELRRAVKDLKLVGAMVHGSSDGKFLDHPSFDGLLSAAEELDVPIYIHPSIPTPNVFEAYYSGLPEGADRVVSTAGWGWHSEVAIQIVRMTHGRHLRQASQAQDDHRPHGRDAAGDAGAARRDLGGRRRASQAQAQPPPSSSRSGSPPAASSPSRRSSPRCRPSASTASCSRSTTRSRRDAQGRKFLDEVALAPADMAKLCHGNADTLLKLKA